MRTVSRKVVVALAVIAIALLIVSLATGFFPGSVMAIILGIYALVVLTKQRDSTAV
jgi:hypothetical protein